MLVADYFSALLHQIEICPVVSANNVMLDTRSDFTGVIRGAIFFIDSTVLYFTEVVDVERRIDRIKYRYQYQRFETNERIFRYDNAKHHPQFPTFPHHKHVGAEAEPDCVIAFSEQSLEDILREIEYYLYRKNFL